MPQLVLAPLLNILDLGEHFHSLPVDCVNEGRDEVIVTFKSLKVFNKLDCYLLQSINSIFLELSQYLHEQINGFES